MEALKIIILTIIIMIVMYIVFRLLAFSLFKSYFQAKSEFLTILQIKKKEKNNGKE